MNFTKSSSSNLSSCSSEKRKEDTRRKILIGAYWLKKAKQENMEKSLYTEMLSFLTKETDRSLFHDFMKK